MAEQSKGVEQSVKDYLNPNERFANRMKAARTGSQGEDEVVDEQKHLFAKNAAVDLNAPDTATGDSVLSKSKKKQSCCPNMTPYILMIALSTHSFFEGLAVGLATDEGSLINIVVAIAVHKSAAAVSLGISLVKTFPNNFSLCRWLIFMFSIASPLGIAVGMVAVNAGDVF